jgi:hypothetical protein
LSTRVGGIEEKGKFKKQSEIGRLNKDVVGCCQTTDVSLIASALFIL